GTGTNQLINFSNSASTTLFTVLENGNVGIGIVSPTKKLTLYEGTPSATQEIRMDGDTNTIHRLAWDLGNKYLEYSQTTGKITLANAGASDFVITNTGNVGIGTTNPGSKLNILGASGTDSEIRLTSTSPNSIGTISFYENTGAAWKIDGQGTGANGNLVFTDVYNARNVLTLKNNGYVGIGTTNPTLGPLQMGSGAYVTTGGVWTNASDRNLKENFMPLDPQVILGKIQTLPIMQWNYKNESATTTHIGPTAQDFYATFGTGGTSGTSTISTIDPSGIALLGIQALVAKVDMLQSKMSILSSNMGASVSSVASSIPGIFTSLLSEKLTVGSPDKRTGVTLYDEVSGMPYCISISNGNQKIVSGECQVYTPAPLQ
ncbi:MAG: tail fiber domain-containing protein, partial [Patescibacteria group bacterium]